MALVKKLLGENNMLAMSLGQMIAKKTWNLQSTKKVARAL